MLRIKFDAKQLLDHLRHAFQGPQLRVITMRLWSAHQLFGKLSQLRLVQPWFPTGTTGRLQAFTAFQFPNIVPSPDCFTADLEFARHVRLNVPSSEQGCGFYSPPFQRPEVSALGGFGIHVKMIP